jgi:NAD(P)-dependent dehydrogenase (short-subunit alcohol dehydrogenase family)
VSALDGKIIVVTGSTRGIGRSIAEACAASGATLVLSARSADAVVEEVSAFQERGWNCSGIAADVANPDDVEALFKHALEVHGHIDAWVNNAGISEGYRPLDELSVAELNDIVRINLLGHLYALRLTVPYFREHGGHILNMTGRGYKGEATPYTAAYASTKTAIASITQSVAEENRDCPKMSVNALVPGMVATDFYVDIKSSPRLEATKDNWRYALDAFGVPLDVVGREAAAILGKEPGRETGRIYNLLRGARLARGIALISWYGMTGKLKGRR